MHNESTINYCNHTTLKHTYTPHTRSHTPTHPHTQTPHIRSHTHDTRSHTHTQGELIIFLII